MRVKIVLLLFLSILVSCEQGNINPRETEKFTKNWKFALLDDSLAANEHFIDSAWRTLDLPHDWSIEGEFSEANLSKFWGGALPGGIGWYRKQFVVAAEDSAKIFTIAFDGVYMNSDVYINGHLLGHRPYGYISFVYDLTPFLHFGSQNTLAVRVDNSQQPNSRWYSGSGIYRNVWLIKTNKVHVDTWGIYITTPIVCTDSAQVLVETTIKNQSTENFPIELITKIVDNKGELVGSSTERVQLAGMHAIKQKQKLSITKPMLWTLENPEQYTAISELRSRSGQVLDIYKTKFGVRSFSFDSEKGFELNGKYFKINGVCNHHDLGALGAAINKSAIERQLRIMKEMGVNAIRTSHNPPAPELLDLCDSMGVLVMDEAFDMWAKQKIDFDYHLYWSDWHEKDLQDFVMRDRNHPSVIIWSIGNEIVEQGDSSGTTIARELASIVKSIDPTRPITSGNDHPGPNNFIINSGALDLIGYNYHQYMYADFPKDYPGKKFISTESVSAFESRNFYQMPSDSIRRWPEDWRKPFTNGTDDHLCSSYDNVSAPWGSTHGETWKIMKKHPFLSGQFIWTGFDYLGEPTPYVWPSRSSYFGIVDLAGFPKDAYYLYQSEWTNKPVLHILPHWNWTVGQTIDVWAYTNFDEVELIINGKSQGVKSKQGDDLHLIWQVVYEPGTLKAVGKNKNGNTQEVVINTAGEAVKLKLVPEENSILANGDDFVYASVTVLDKDDNVVPYADNMIQFETSENLEIVGVDNGLQTSLESFKAKQHKAFNSKCMVIVKATGQKGEGWIKAKADGVDESEAKLMIK